MIKPPPPASRPPAEIPDNTHKSGATPGRIAAAFLSVRDFMEFSGLGRTTVYELIADKSLQSVKFGRRRLIPTEAAEGWRDALTATPAQPQPTPERSARQPSRRGRHPALHP